MENAAVISTMRYWELISEHGALNEIEPALLAGLICQESAGNPYASRHEPRFRWLPKDVGIIKSRKPVGMSFDTEFQGLKTSWGLCQMMGEVWREMGFRGWWLATGQPDLSIKYGARFLAAKIATHGGDVRHGLLAYNGGGVPEYPEKVMEWSEMFTGV